MKVVVYAPMSATAPLAVQAIETERVTSRRALRSTAERLSGGEFMIVVFDRGRGGTAADAARLARPRARVVLVEGGKVFDFDEGTKTWRHRPMYVHEEL